jgi:hypothetical protein
LPESLPHRRIVNDADARDFPRLLPMRRERPGDRRSTDDRDEFPPSRSSIPSFDGRRLACPIKTTPKMSCIKPVF